jgi:hypothetical protein
VHHGQRGQKRRHVNEESESSDDEEDLWLHFKGLGFSQIEKNIELVKSINKKDELLENQEDLLVKEHEKYFKLEKALAYETEKCIILTDDLKVCNDSISYFKFENVDLNAKIKEINIAHASTSFVEHVVICTRCKDVDIDALIENFALIQIQNEHIAKLDAKFAEHELEK